jgi:hypothetical protein
MTFLVAFAETRVWGSTNCWSLISGQLGGEGIVCLVRFEIQGDQKSGFHLVVEPTGFFAADTWHPSKAEAISAATSLGVATDAWSA